MPQMPSFRTMKFQGVHILKQLVLVKLLLTYPQRNQPMVADQGGCMASILSQDDVRDGVFPTWTPTHFRNYVELCEKGLSYRALARLQKCPPSTILRQVRRIEHQRQDPLLDGAVLRLFSNVYPKHQTTKGNAMSMHARNLKLPNQQTLEREARRVLRRLSEPDAVLIVSDAMEVAAVVRLTTGTPVRTGAVSRSVAQAFALKDWIRCKKNGSVRQYELTSQGRNALKRLLADEQAQKSQREPTGGFAEQHQDFITREMEDPENKQETVRLRINLAESPLGLLARRRDRDGRPFLTEGMLVAGERLREDFELAQMGPSICQNWEKFLTAGARGKMAPTRDALDGPSGARKRVHEALTDLGPGLGDIALRCCCHLEGLEAAEKRMGWAARSGKVVLRIALQRLSHHYAERYGAGGPLIG